MSSTQTDWRGLCEELAGHLALLDEPPHEVVCRAQELLSQPEPEVVGVSDEELFRIASDSDALYIADDRDYDNYSEVVAAMRAAIAADRARWGHPAPAQPEPEVVGVIDFRAELQRLVNAADEYVSSSATDDEFFTAKEHARALLDQPEPEVGPTDEELLSLDQLREAWNAQADAANSWDELGIDEIIWWTQRQALARWGRPAPAPAGEVAELVGPSDEELWEMYQGAGTFSPIEFARAAIAADRARYGRPAAAPAGEVGELVAWLRQRFPSVAHIPGSDYHLANRAADMLEHRDLSLPDCERNLDSILSPSGGYEMDADAALRDGAQLVNGEWWAPVFGCDSLELTLCRIRERMERQAAPVPVASDTRYEFSVYDEDYTEQAGGSAPTYAQALSEGQRYLAQYQQDGPHTLELRRVEVLHPDAPPLPGGEVEHG